MVYVGAIAYRMKREHPDWLHSDQDEQKVHSFGDVYKFDDSIYADEDEETISDYIRRDLRLIAGGGYGTKGLDVVSIQVRRVA